MQVGCLPTSPSVFCLKDLDGGPDGAELLLNVSRLTRLHALGLTCDYAVTLAIPDHAFGQQPVLEQLEIKGFDSINFNPNAAVLRSLQRLRLDSCNLADVPHVLAGAPRLCWLSLQTNPDLRMRDFTCVMLISMPKLERVWLAKAPLSDEEDEEGNSVEPVPGDDEVMQASRFCVRFAQRHPGVSAPTVDLACFNYEKSLWKAI